MPQAPAATSRSSFSTAVRYKARMANRYFVAPLPAPGRGTIDGELAHHLGRVLRVRPGEVVRLGDGCGNTAEARVHEVGRDRVLLDVEAARHEPPPPLAVTLAFAVPRHTRTEWLLEHGTEVGVTTFQPLWTERTRPQGERSERWARIVHAAAGQCDRAWLPSVAAARELQDFLRSPTLPDTRWLASADGPRGTAAVPEQGACVLLVGPEGGFSEPEQAALAAARFQPLRLGPYVLRTETAALVGAALLLAH
jgi:16S rRNA (uracil1498-N3)-methyltransferase